MREDGAPREDGDMLARVERDLWRDPAQMRRMQSLAARLGSNDASGRAGLAALTPAPRAVPPAGDATAGWTTEPTAGQLLWVLGLLVVTVGALTAAAALGSATATAIGVAAAPLVLVPLLWRRPMVARILVRLHIRRGRR